MGLLDSLVDMAVDVVTAPIDIVSNVLEGNKGLIEATADEAVEILEDGVKVINNIK